MNSLSNKYTITKYLTLLLFTIITYLLLSLYCDTKQGKVYYLIPELPQNGNAGRFKYFFVTATHETWFVCKPTKYKMSSCQILLGVNSDKTLFIWRRLHWWYGRFFFFFFFFTAVSLIIFNTLAIFSYFRNNAFWDDSLLTALKRKT